ncbi:MAG: TetR/AcrR family transcriptional regulator [Candidatus Marinimicrobia bacterium]|nr:TetR/AcrR family transcriptional regulator [Candidatus Neomarinimicrobiota bacterium]MBT3576362.1 TetR/AcrR family transcriptional regulator [Candidatus Neomarinimicrobiota bacterium]MBT3680060.1 TetR/AcrR family transcriptional regulator [Candidatus Neomarinimicrobiota bacterium]MBT3950045.1 TetR/AcrR family transcriptional regulator [Candidatus Neomarinimicrobiota bacterium]MBT4253991.1 TetR/AcrR family transcriptional regulator [Candidatus Neomarinimicrobiota bacterium]
MDQSKTDRRVTRTKTLLRSALMSLMTEQSYDTITVQDILDRADVGRSTFYSHYRDKDELLISGMDDILHSLIHTLEHPGHCDHQKILSTEPLFQHAQDQFPLHKAIMGGQGINLMVRKIQRHLGQHVEDELKKWLHGDQKSEVPISLLGHHVASVLLTLLRWWFDNNKPYTPAKMDAMFQKLVMPGIIEAMSSKN